MVKHNGYMAYYQTADALYIIGGWDGTQSTNQMLNKIIKYTPQNGWIEDIGTTTQVRHRFSATGISIDSVTCSWIQLHWFHICCN